MGCNVTCMRKVKRVFVLRDRDVLATHIGKNAKIMFLIMDFLDLKELARFSSVNMTFYCIAGKEQLLVKFQMSLRKKIGQKYSNKDAFMTIPKPISTSDLHNEDQRNTYSYVLATDVNNKEQDQTILNSSRTILSHRNSCSKITRNNFLTTDETKEKRYNKTPL